MQSPLHTQFKTIFIMYFYIYIVLGMFISICVCKCRKYMVGMLLGEMHITITISTSFTV